MFRKSGRAANDTEAYRQHYPGQVGLDDVAKSENLRFYQNKIPSRPDGALINTIHLKWWGQYGGLECHHGYIQWLFPIHELGMNWDAQVLQRHEAVSICADPALQARVVLSYRLMLDFYGMTLANELTGEIHRRPVGQFEGRYRNLNASSHNYLRITRILKCLGEFGFEHFKLPFLLFVLSEITLHGHLGNAERSCLDYWVPCLRQQTDRDALASEHMAMKQEQTRKISGDCGSAASDDAGVAAEDNRVQRPHTIKSMFQRSKKAAPVQTDRFKGLHEDAPQEPVANGAKNKKRKNSTADDEVDSQATELDS